MLTATPPSAPDIVFPGLTDGHQLAPSDRAPHEVGADVRCPGEEQRQRENDRPRRQRTGFPPATRAGGVVVISHRVSEAQTCPPVYSDPKTVVATAPSGFPATPRAQIVTAMTSDDDRRERDA